MTQQKLNSLIPMEDPDGNRCFANQWAARAADEGARRRAHRRGRKAGEAAEGRQGRGQGR